MSGSSRPRITGFCNPSNPPDSHARCTGDLIIGPAFDPVPCECPCHLQPELAAVAAPAPAAPAIGAREPGFYDDIAEADYHRDPASLSHSGAKTLLKAPALFRHEQQNPVFKREFDFGHAAHAEVLGVGAQVAVLDFADRRTNAYKDAEKAARAAGQVPLLKKEYSVVQAMANELASHRLAMELLSDGKPEVSAYAPDAETGIMRRCRFDWLGPIILSDYKSADSSDPNAFRRKVAEFGYHQQAGWYLDLARDLGHPAEAFAFIVQMKKAPYLVSVVELIPAAIDRGRDLNRRALQMYRDCVDADVWPGYIPDNEFASIDLPVWAYNDHEVEMSA